MQDEQSTQQWKDLGSPLVPAVKVGSYVGTILHVSQLFSLLGLAMPAEFDERRFAWDIETMLETWLRLVQSLSWDAFIMPTPARSRSTRDLVGDVFEKIAEGPRARNEGDYRLTIDTEHIAQRLQSTTDAVRYMEGHIADWQAFLMEHYDAQTSDAGPDVMVWEQGSGRDKSNGKPWPFSIVLGFLRNHTAMHLKQVTTALDRAGIEHPSDGLDAFKGLHLPADVYGTNAAEMGRLDHVRLV
ncbi:MAG TPA: hypothetical protein VGG22_03220 [Candidatus Baltobacteraceae bacterium]